MRKKLAELRKKFGYTQKNFAKIIGISVQTYRNIEQSICEPKEQLKRKIMNELNTSDKRIFENFEPVFKYGTACRNVLVIMNMINNNYYKKTDIANIRTTISMELKDREKMGILIHTKTEDGNVEMNKRCEKILIDMGSKLRFDDVVLYRKCRKIENEMRTEKSSWSIPNISSIQLNKINNKNEFIIYKIKFNPTTGAILNNESEVKAKDCIEYELGYNPSTYKIVFKKIDNM